MDCTEYQEENLEKKVCIVGSELVDNYTVYIIEVKVGDHKWIIKHRYSDFHDLHEKLTSEKKIDKHLLPPKKIIGKNSKSLVEKRQKELEVYLQTLLVRFPVAAPKVLSCFLQFHAYEINGIAAALAEELFHKGEQLLVAGEVFLLRPLQLYAITQQLRLAKPTCANGDAKADLGHILDFTCRLKYLKIPGTKGVVGTSNIQEDRLPFDLSVFKSLLQIEISYCDSAQINGLPSLKPTLATLSVHHSTTSMKDIIVPEASEFAQWVPEGVDTNCPVTAIIPTWKTLTTLDMSHNLIACIDESVKLIPQVEFLDLSHNELSHVENLQHLYNLIHLDLSYNNLAVLEGVHTKLGNIKTLNLAGNQLETLSGLTKLYSLVNLDLSSNKLAQIDEIKPIGTLPCLEKLSLVNNPMCIIPDYRTKVLAQFWDRASEVCLDHTATTEKELDTVEVLKAIQKAKEAKDRMANNDKKISEDPRQSAGGGAPPLPSHPSSSSSNLAALPAPQSPTITHSASSSQEIVIKEEAIADKNKLTPVDSVLTKTCWNTSSEKIPKVTTQLHDPFISCEMSTEQQLKYNTNSCCCCAEDLNLWTDRQQTPVLPCWLLSYTTAIPEFNEQLSALISKVAQENDPDSAVPGEDLHSEPTNLGAGQHSGDGYFEMGPDCSEDGSAPSSSPSSPLQAEQAEEQGAVDKETNQHITKMLWAHCIRVGKGVSQLACCLVLTERLLTVLCIRRAEQPATVTDLLEGLEVEMVVPYSNVDALWFCVPDTCLSLRLSSNSTRWHFFADSGGLKEVHMQMGAQLKSQAKLEQNAPSSPASVTQLLWQHLHSWEWEESDGAVKVGHAAHLLDPHGPESQPRPHADILSRWCPSKSVETTDGVAEGLASVPCILFLTPRHLCVLKVDFLSLVEHDGPDGQGTRLCSRLTRVPLAAVLLSPRQGCPGHNSLAVHHFHDGHILKLMAGSQQLTTVFILPHDKFLFLRQLSQYRTGLKDIKTLAFLQSKSYCHRRSGHHSPPTKVSQKGYRSSGVQGIHKPLLALSVHYPSEPLIQKLSEENQCPPHLNLSPSLHYLSSLRGDELVEFFHSSIAEVENEEMKHIIWSSVLFYKSPEMEMTACIMLSTKALYFILDDAASTLSDQAHIWSWQPSEIAETDFIISYCFAMKLNDLHSVNVGLFDQYFRVVGQSADDIISCLSRDSYGTHRFLQQLMTVLSLLEKVPSPEPSEQDFYAQFGNKSTGKMENYELVHSSKVKFVYPSEEEIGDLTFVVAERKGPQGSPPRSFHILLYLLVFEVQLQGPSQPPQPLLLPKTLILTATDIFLLEEDHISYPLPHFAKEPPQRERYRLADARRIRDLDRVLMGYQTYPQALTLVFDDVPAGPDLLCHLTMDHFSEQPAAEGAVRTTIAAGPDDGEVQWCVFVPAPDSRERLISLLARQWEALCSRELPVELTG
ncbi:nischarin [Sardina pilchardus]|uniref:nischarin n=1 Tax=Sardina pilchardus TaxID=27697 RepID=UPI002E167318